MRRKRRVLVIDGGGAKGIIPATVLASVEEALRMPICHAFDLIVGTSVGGIIGGVLSSGGLDATGLLAMMKEVLPSLFTRARMWPFLPRHDRGVFVRAWTKLIPPELPMSQCRTRFMTSAVSVCDSLPHYFKSWEGKDGDLPLLTAVLRTFAAPLYFGGLVDERERTVWLDGGTGGDSCPLFEALYDALPWIYNGDHVHILSLGCGHSSVAMSYKRATRQFGKNMREVGLFTDMKNGGLARVQASRRAVEFSRRIAKFLPSVSFQRVDTEISEAIDLMDGVKYLDQYETIGKQLAGVVDLSQLRG